MKNLLRLIFFTGIMAFITPPLAFREVITCAPAKYYFRATITTVKDGLWSDPGIWSTGALPTAADKVTINHNVTCDINTSVSGVEVAVSGVLRNLSLLFSSGNIINTGRIEMIQTESTKQAVIRFTGINEAAFAGGGMDVLDSDVGLWTMGAGQLIIKGAEKTSWTRLTGGAAAGSSTINVKQAKGWLAGDEIVITPTAAGDYTGFEERTILAVNGTTVVLDQPLALAHPMVNNEWTAEVMNLTRNVRIEGTANGRSHIFIRSSNLQMIENAGLRYLGPRKQQGGDGATEAVLGRYGLHIHHSMDGSRGTVVRGCAARDIGNNVYVSHVSHGVRMIDNIAYNILGAGFWWDQGPEESSHDIAWIGNIVAKCDFVRRSQDVFDTDGGPVLSARAFMLNHGDDDTAINNVAVGVYGDPHDGGGYKWEAVNNDRLEGVWFFKGNMAHNIDAAGLISWQNVQMNHLITGYTTYNCREGIFHGAYANSYRYDSVFAFNAPVVIHAASSNSSRIRFENSTLGDVVIEGSPLGGALPILFRNCTFNKLTDQVSSPTHNVDVIQCTGQVVHAGGNSEIIRIQPATGQATRKAGSSTTDISTFAPAVWSNGRGLKGEYFTNTSFTGQPAFTRIDNVLAFSEWGNGVHYKIGSTYSVRWTGYFQSQFNEKYTVTASAPGTVRLYINNSQYAGSASLDLEAGKWYSIKVDYIKNNNQRGGMELKWRSASLDKFSPGGEYIPTCQLNDVPVTALPLGDRPIATLPRDPRYTGIKLIDNPVGQTIKLQVPAGRHEYVITDAVGRLLDKGRLNANSINLLNVAALASGIYIIKVVPQKGDPVALKIVKY